LYDGAVNVCACRDINSDLRIGNILDIWRGNVLMELRFWISYNGGVYNFKEIRKELNWCALLFVRQLLQYSVSNNGHND
jgi:hypothetical protein